MNIRRKTKKYFIIYKVAYYVEHVPPAYNIIKYVLNSDILKMCFYKRSMVYRYNSEIHTFDLLAYGLQED